MSTGTVEATAPCRVDLAGGTVGGWPLDPSGSGAVAVSVAIDRRVWCRVEGGVEGVHVESKDTLQKASAATVGDLLESGRLSLVAEVLRALAVETGIRVQTQSRVPLGSGLGASSALTVALGAALSTGLGQPALREGLEPLLRDVGPRSGHLPAGAQDYATALHGGVQLVHLEAGEMRAEALSVDPARVEESLFLVEASDPTPPRSVDRKVTDRDESSEGAREALARIAFLAEGVRQALLDDRLDDVVELFAEEWEARKSLDPAETTPQVDRVAEVAHAAGGAAKVCGPGGQGVVAVWAPPGARGSGRHEAVQDALGAAGFRVFRARVDLRGLEVD